MMNKQGILAVITALALVIASACAIGMYNGWKAEKGDTGETGEMGPIGLTGLTGDIGDTPEYEWNGTSIRFKNLDDIWGNWTDLIGDKGDDGNIGPTGNKGSKGNQGNPGIDGIDKEPNDAPLILVNDFGSYVEGCHWTSDFRYNLNITTEDTEDDARRVLLYTKWDTNDNWDLSMIRPNVYNNSYQLYYKEKSGNGYWGDRTMYWLVEVMDGENLVYLEGNTTLVKTLCPP